MGEDKALLSVRPGVTQIEYALTLLRSVCRETVIGAGPRRVIEPGRYPSAELIWDDPLAEGPMAGVIAGLRRANGKALLVVACDMPYLDTPALGRLIAGRRPAARATVFIAGDSFPEPMCALYEPTALADLEMLARAGKSSLRRYLLDADVGGIALDRPQLLASVNNPADLEQARRVFARE